jgi:hypothetical protein
VQNQCKVTYECALLDPLAPDSLHTFGIEYHACEAVQELARIDERRLKSRRCQYGQLTVM